MTSSAHVLILAFFRKEVLEVIVITDIPKTLSASGNPYWAKHISFNFKLFNKLSWKHARQRGAQLMSFGVRYINQDLTMKFSYLAFIAIFVVSG